MIWWYKNHQNLPINKATSLCFIEVTNKELFAIHF